MLSVSCISLEIWVFCLLLLHSLMICANYRIHYDPMVIFVCLHTTIHYYHHYADLSTFIELLKYLPGAFCLECVSKIKPVISVTFHAIYGPVCIQLTRFRMMIVRIHTLSVIIKSEVWPISHCLGLGHKIMVSAVCLIILLLIS